MDMIVPFCNGLSIGLNIVLILCIMSNYLINFLKKWISDPDYDMDKTEEFVPNNLDDRMKYYEKKIQCYIPANRPFMVRLDGRCFSNQTKGLVRPYDEMFAKAMLLTAKDALMEFHAASAYTQSDEITLIFSNNDNKDAEHIFGGRTDKILSLTAGYVSTSFTANFTKLLNENYERYESYLNANKNYYCFDSRIIIYPEDKTHEIVNNILWRSKYDCYRNFVSRFSEYYFPAKSLNNISTKKRIEKLLKEKNIDLNAFKTHYKYGWFIKRIECDVMTKTGMCIRTKPIAFSVNPKFSDEFLQILLKNKLTDKEINNFDFDEQVELIKLIQYVQPNRDGKLFVNKKEIIKIE